MSLFGYNYQPRSSSILGLVFGLFVILLLVLGLVFGFDLDLGVDIDESFSFGLNFGMGLSFILNIRSESIRNY